tara:strand:+ start:1022 stop:1591 length:570 start_codon:yes stop_codon:yes gene_type:complete
MISKPFDLDLYKRTDALGKDGVIKELQKYFPSNYTIKETEDRYAVDITVLDSTGTPYCYVEVEVKEDWHDNVWPFKSMHVPQRKNKFANLGKQTIFITFNADCTGYVACDNKTMLASSLKEIPNRYISSNEFFYDVNLNDIHRNDLTQLLRNDNGTPTKIKSNKEASDNECNQKRKSYTIKYLHQTRIL